MAVHSAFVKLKMSKIHEAYQTATNQMRFSSLKSIKIRFQLGLQLGNLTALSHPHPPILFSQFTHKIR